MQRTPRLDVTCLPVNILSMAWEVEFTDEFGEWYGALDESAQDTVDRTVRLLEQRGPTLPHPYSSSINASKHGHMRELRVQSKGRPLRVLYAFDPRRIAILLIGGDKTGDDAWYERFVPRADALYDDHLETLARESEEPDGRNG